MLQSSYAITRKNLEKAKMHNKLHFDRHVHVPQFKVGNQVLGEGRKYQARKIKKLEARYVGPYAVIGIEEPNLLVRTKRSEVLNIHANRVKHFFP